jgi:hypothetical protein
MDTEEAATRLAAFTDSGLFFISTNHAATRFAALFDP